MKGGERGRRPLTNLPGQLLLPARLSGRGVRLAAGSQRTPSPPSAPTLADLRRQNNSNTQRPGGRKGGARSGALPPSCLRRRGLGEAAGRCGAARAAPRRDGRGSRAEARAGGRAGGRGVGPPPPGLAARPARLLEAPAGVFCTAAVCPSRPVALAAPLTALPQPHGRHRPRVRCPAGQHTAQPRSGSSGSWERPADSGTRVDS